MRSGVLKTTCLLPGGACAKAKANDGYVPNHAAGGAISSTAEPAVGSKVLLELYKRFQDDWIVQLLLDDLIDWNDWQWERCAASRNHN